MHLTATLLFGLEGEKRRLPLHVAIVGGEADEALVRDAFAPELEEIAACERSTNDTTVSE